MNKQRNAILSKQLSEYFGKNFAVNYHDSFNFK